jgi:hypothetical protein
MPLTGFGRRMLARLTSGGVRVGIISPRDVSSGLGKPHGVVVPGGHRLARSCGIQPTSRNESLVSTTSIFEGARRQEENAGKGGTIKRFMEHLNPGRGAHLNAGGRPREAGRARTRPVVLPAVHQPPADRGRDRAVRPVVVQPRRRRAGDGLLQPHRVPRVHAPGARSSSACSCADGITLFKYWFSVSRASRASLRNRGGPIRSSSGSSPRWTWPRSTSGTTTPRPRRRCSSTPTPPGAVDGGATSQRQEARAHQLHAPHCSTQLPYAEKMLAPNWFHATRTAYMCPGRGSGGMFSDEAIAGTAMATEF